jgi:micrococcal nuclease
MYTYMARLNRVIDGDTYVFDIDLGFYVTTTQHIRLIGVDCPERFTPEGKRATQFAIDWLAIHGNEAYLQTDKGQTKTFDRWVADVWSKDPRDGGNNLRDDLINAGHFKGYEPPAKPTGFIRITGA